MDGALHLGSDDLSTARCLEAVIAVAAALGLPTHDPVIVRDRTNVLVHLRPAPVVARVPLTLARLRPPSWFATELAVASFLASAGAPAVGPTAEVDPGPHEHRGGLLVTFWPHVEHDPSRFDATAAGRSLRELHHALEGYEEALPAFDRLHELGELLARLEPSNAVSADELHGLRRRQRELRPPTVIAAQPLHGDAHLNNILWSPGGPLWSDLENVCRGPVEYDLAALLWRGGAGTTETVAAYGPYEASILAEVTPLLALFLASWTLVVLERAPSEEGLAWARTRIARALSGD